MHPAAQPVDELLRDCNISFQRRSGPGGQHRNKVETAAILRHTPSGIQAEANEKRSQADNRKEALKRLRFKLALELRTELTPEVSERWQIRARKAKISVSENHEDFPTVLAELLDVLHALEYSMPAASERLAVSSSQLLKLLRMYSPAFALVNAERQKIGLRKLK